MGYNPTNWEDRQIERPNTFQMQNNPDGTITLIPSPGTVTKQGTPTNAANLNKIEQALVSQDASLNNKANKSDFTNSLSINGWRKSVDGTIEQWGSMNVTISTVNQWTGFYANNFPIAFPNSCLNITCSLDPTNQYAQVGVAGPTKTQYNLYAKGETTGTITIKWRAIGN